MINYLEETISKTAISVKNIRDKFSHEINQPFEISFKLPNSKDKLAGSYSPKFVKKMRAIVECPISV